MTSITPSIDDLPISSAVRSIGRPRSKVVRKIRECGIMAMLIGCGAFSLAITITIIIILFGETSNFFTAELVDAQNNVTEVSVTEFFFGDVGYLADWDWAGWRKSLQWNPLLGEEKNFFVGSLIWGTLMISGVAMLFALPLGLVTAIWLSEYANPKVRAVIKPVLEVLAGIPTVVFGFFALTVITPALRFEFLQVTDASGNLVPWNPLDFGTYNALGAGIAVGIMCLPIVTSLSEDALQAVPKALREGSFGVGASRFETSIRVVMPAALSGIVAAFLLAIARAVGETMIVALAAGASPINVGQNLESLSGATGMVDPRMQVQPMTGYMVQIFLGDAAHGGVEYYSSYAVAATLFVMTFGLTLLGSRIRKRFRQAYD